MLKNFYHLILGVLCALVVSVPAQAAERFKKLPHIKLINVDEGKHLWVGEPMVYRILSEIVGIVAPQRLPLPEEV